jgi:hypothetical protein
MTDLWLLIWLIATALMIITVLTVGTLAAADLLPHRQQEGPRRAASPAPASAPMHHLSHSSGGEQGRHDRAA